MALNVLENYGVVSTADGTACEEAASLGLVSNLNGEAQRTRQEAAVIVARLMDIIGTLPEADLSTLASYEDVDEIADWAGEAVAQLTACGLLSGSEGAFNPQAQMTNEQAVALLVRMDENPSPSVTYHSAAGARSHPAVSAAQSVVALGGGNMMLSRSPLWDLAR